MPMSELVMIDFREGGYFTYPNPSDTIYSDTELDNASVKWLRALSAAREGSFDGVAQLLEEFPGKQQPLLRHAYTRLLGDAGPESCVESVRLKLRDTDSPLDSTMARRFGYVLAETGKLADIPLLLEIYLRFRGDKDFEIFPVWIAALIEPDPEVFCDPSDYFDIQDYRRDVMSRYELLVEALGSSEVYVFEGAPFGVVRLARMMLNRLREEDFTPEYRQRFEASTGIDCRSFYKDGWFQPLNAAAILEDFMRGSGPERFEEGVRYFFGHRIP
jgi:hypothetical protein